MIERVLPDGNYEQRYSVRLGSVKLGRFVRRPLSMVPPEGTIAMVDNGTRERTGSRSSAAKFREGKFRSLKFEPTHWTVDE